MAGQEYVVDVGTGEASTVPFTPPEIEPVDAAPPESVTARQFKMQLVIAGLKAQVDGWIASQDEIVQVAYEYSGTFVKSEPMMQAGFVALGFTDQQRDDFFLAASKL